MTAFLARRLAGTLLALLAISLVVFMALAATPGDAALALAGDSASAAQLQELRRQMGLDRPLLARYAVFVGNAALHGDLGRSLVNNRPVSEIVLERLPYTAALALSAVSLAILAGGVVGTIAALQASTVPIRRSWVGRRWAWPCPPSGAGCCSSWPSRKSCAGCRMTRASPQPAACAAST